MAVFRLKKDELIPTWWRSYYEVEANSKEEAAKMISDDEVDCYDSEPLPDLDYGAEITSILDEYGEEIYCE